MRPAKATHLYELFCWSVHPLVRSSAGPLVRNKRTILSISHSLLIQLKSIFFRGNINKGYNLMQGQGRWVKGQGQINDFLKNWFWL